MHTHGGMLYDATDIGHTLYELVIVDDHRQPIFIS
jgi:hypothetical protein